MVSSRNLEGRLAVVTGGAGGIGAATAARLRTDGADVLLVDSSPAVHEVAARMGGRSLQLDVTVRDAGIQIAAAALAQAGAIDILVNNAGVGRARGLAETPDDALERMLTVNLVAVLRVTRDLMKHLKRPGGRIISISSTLGLAGHPGTTVYGVAKAGVAHMTRQLAAELGPEGILVNAIAPGVIDTPMTTERVHGDAFYQRSFIHAAPLRRAGSADEIASVVAFLASDDASYVSGQVIAVDGGWLAGRHLARDWRAQ
jgi:3-oxoacyl-[acyl-carrier protein] reductase